ncbi:MAG TPA: peroxidase family protein [Saprospiraceae bacterium]|nr:peroxidase family protein [Saprospiraceae bacterium]
MKLSLSQRAIVGFFKGVNGVISWHRLPKWFGILNLLSYRYELRAKNLYDTYPSPEHQGDPKTCPFHDTKFYAIRNSDGKFNDVNQPLMGCTGMRFGRNMPREFTAAPTQEELLNPNPRVISEKLMKRTEFKPATIVNLLAAPWIQFMVHDWFGHYDSEELIEIPLPPGDNWSEPKMRVHRTLADTPLHEIDRKFPVYRNKNTHWWDGSQIYGSTEAMTQVLRGNAGDGKLHVEEGSTDHFLPRDHRGIPISGFTDNWWTGLELLHTIFALEHNSICSELKRHFPAWTSDQLFDTARLINCALMAKIHTVEWTPAILPHPALQIAMNANWWGLLGEKLYKMWGRVGKGEVLSGIPGSGVDHHGAPFSLTEEFVSVYRLHTLLPDNIAFYDVQTGKHKTTLDMKEVIFEKARRPMQEGLTYTDLFYSFGINYPGAITIHNFPNFLRDVITPDGKHLDMATVDILKDRERGVPRYNTFRRLIHMSPAKNFEDLTGGNKLLAKEVSDIYGGDIEKVDLQIGMYCEPLPKGFGFSDTAFRIFILMASRRLKSDRFLASDFKPLIYTKPGMDWVQNMTMKDVLVRHYPELRAPMRNVKNAFHPWEKVGG